MNRPPLVRIRPMPGHGYGVIWGVVLLRDGAPPRIAAIAIVPHENYRARGEEPTAEQLAIRPEIELLVARVALRALAEIQIDAPASELARSYLERSR